MFFLLLDCIVNFTDFGDSLVISFLNIFLVEMRGKNSHRMDMSFKTKYVVFVPKSPVVSKITPFPYNRTLSL